MSDVMQYIYWIGVVICSILSGIMHKPEEGEDFVDVVQGLMVSVIWPLFLLAAVGLSMKEAFRRD